MTIGYTTIPKLAESVGVTPPTVRSWIAKGWISAPEHWEDSGALVYSPSELVEIQRWYLRRCASGLSRGIGARDKQQKALAALERTRSYAD